jgi:hypothetical protein
MQREIEASLKSRIFSSLINARNLLDTFKSNDNASKKNIVFDLSIEIERAVFYMILICGISRLGAINYSPNIKKGEKIDLIAELDKSINYAINSFNNGVSDCQEALYYLLKIRELTFHLYKEYL